MKDQGHGRHWETVLGDGNIVGNLNKIIQHSGVLSKTRAEVDFGNGMEESNIFTLMTPINNSPVSFMTVFAGHDSPDTLVSSYPFVRWGDLFKGKIIDVEIWGNNVEAVVTMESGITREISFFATDYHINKEKYQVGAYCEVRLAAFAYECKEQNRQDMAIPLNDNDAKTFWTQLREDIRNQFGKDTENLFSEDADNGSSLFLDTSNMAPIYPISEDYKGDYQFLSPAQDVRPFETEGTRMLQVGILVDNFDLGLMTLPLFVRESMFDGHDNPKPEVGQSVSGTFWLQGHLDKWYEGLKGPEVENVIETETEILTDKDWISDILYESWKKFREVASTWTNIDKEQACQVFADIIRDHTQEESGFFVKTNVLPEGSAGKKKVDIVCGFEEDGKVLYSCAIILKVIDNDNSFTSKMFRIYKDLHFLENILDGHGNGQGYSECSFYLITGTEAFRTKPAYRTKSDDFPKFGLNGQTTAKYVRYHDNRESGEKQELVFRKEYNISWEPQTDASDWQFLEIDINDDAVAYEETVDCIIGVFRFKDEESVSYMHDIIDEEEYDSLTSRYPDRKLEAAFRLSKTPFDNAEGQSWTLLKGKILYASDIKVSKSAHSVICDVLYDFLVINTKEMGGKTLRVKMEDRKLIRYFSEAEVYLLVGKEKSGIVGKVKATYFEVDTEKFE